MDNRKAFTDWLFGVHKCAATGAPELGTLCAVLDIEHRLSAPKSPQTNAVGERFNARIKEVLKSYHLRS